MIYVIRHRQSVTQQAVEMLTFILSNKSLQLKANTMKKLFACLAATLLLVTLAPIQSKAENKKSTVSVASTKTGSVEMEKMINRVNEIKAMDRSTMSSSEKKELRKELKTLKMDVNNASQSNGGGTVYVSAGLIIIILLLIILL